MLLLMTVIFCPLLSPNLSVDAKSLLQQAMCRKELEHEMQKALLSQDLSHIESLSAAHCGGDEWPLILSCTMECVHAWSVSLSSHRSFLHCFSHQPNRSLPPSLSLSLSLPILCAVLSTRLMDIADEAIAFLRKQLKFKERVEIAIAKGDVNVRRGIFMLHVVSPCLWSVEGLRSLEGAL